MAVPQSKTRLASVRMARISPIYAIPTATNWSAWRGRRPNDKLSEAVLLGRPRVQVFTATTDKKIGLSWSVPWRCLKRWERRLGPRRLAGVRAKPDAGSHEG